jgi:F-type H+-transporting ATPase subunit epsilon
VNVTIVSAEREVWRGDADLVTARSPEGEFGIMRGHIPFLAALVPGLITVSAGSERKTFLATGGFLEASAGGFLEASGQDYHVIVLADDAEEVGEISFEETTRRLEEIRRSQAEDRTQNVAEAGVRASVAKMG